MKKKLFYFTFTLLFLVGMISSCKKDKDAAEKFSTLSVEENKANVENAGIDFVNVMSRMQSIDPIKVIINFGKLTNSSPAKGQLSSKDIKFYSTLETLVAATTGEKKLNDLFNAMASTKGLSADYQSIKEFWDSKVGTYTWNPGQNVFDQVLGGTKIIFLFPSTDVSTTNDATLTISNYTGINISNPIDVNYTGDLPLSLNADIKVDGATIVTYVFSASYNTNGIPSSVISDLTVGIYKFRIDIVNNTTEVSINYKLLENGNVVLDLGASGSGLFTEENIDANTTDGTKIGEIINSASAHFQIFNVALRGDVDVKGLTDQLNIIDDQYSNQTIDNAESDSLYAIQLNKFMNLRLVNVSNNEIMAKAQAYVVHEIDSFSTYLNFRLTFSDESVVDLDTYLNSGFNDFVAEVNSFITDFNANYDTNLTLLDY